MRYKLFNAGLNLKVSLQLRMSAIMSGTGNQTLSLPRTLKATYKGINFTVAIPRGTNVEFSQLGNYIICAFSLYIVHHIFIHF